MEIRTLGTVLIERVEVATNGKATVIQRTSVAMAETGAQVEYLMDALALNSMSGARNRLREASMMRMAVSGAA